jgi:hypothetical protein
VYVYHEPTAAAWNVSIQNRYPGETVIRSVGPLYDDSHISGSGCLVRSGGTRWTAYAQSNQMGSFAVSQLDEYEFDTAP